MVENVSWNHLYLQLDLSNLPAELLDESVLENVDMLLLDDLFKDPLFEFPEEDEKEPIITNPNAETNGHEVPKGDMQANTEHKHDSPCSSESDNLASTQNCEGATNAKQTSGSFVTPRVSGIVDQRSNLSKTEEDEAKKMARMQRNRVNAYLSRQRKKQQFQQLQASVAHFKMQNSQLLYLLQRLTAENSLLRHHLTDVCSKFNVPVPEIPSCLQETRQQNEAVASGGSMQDSAVSGVLSFNKSPPMVPPNSGGIDIQPNTSSSAIGHVQTQCSAPPSPNHTSGVGEQHSAKRKRISGAGAVFLTLFSVFMFASPYIPRNAQHPRDISGALPGYTQGFNGIVSTSASDFSNGMDDQLHVSRHGRSLMAIDKDRMDLDCLDGPQNSKCLVNLFNETVEELLQNPKSKSLPDRALKKLQDLAPVAVLLNPDIRKETLEVDEYEGIGRAVAELSGSHRESADPMSASVAFPMLASHFFNADGLGAPQTCEKVFEFSASEVSHPLRSKKSVESYILRNYGFKGRSTGLKVPPSVVQKDQDENHQRNKAALTIRSEDYDFNDPKPSEVFIGSVDYSGQHSTENDFTEDEPQYLSSELLDSDLEYDSASSDSHKIILPSQVDEPMLVSLLLPNASHGSQSDDSDTLNAIDRVFVITLHPQDRFVAYSCGLSKPLLM